MKILVTGANGYIGQGIVRKLLDNDFDVVSTDINDSYIDKRSTIKVANLFDIDNPYEYFDKPDIVLHLAWRGIYNHNSIDIMNDLPRHYAFLKSMIDNGVKHLCCMGTMHEVGFWEGVINDSTPRNPLSLYGICKNALRESILTLKNSNDFVFQWLMGFYTIGNDKVVVNDGNVFLKIAQAEKRGDDTFPFVTGNNKFDFVDYDELINMIFSVITQTDIEGTIYCCSGKPVSLKKKAEEFIKNNKYRIKLNIGAYPDRKTDPKIIYGDPTKINLILNNKNGK